MIVFFLFLNFLMEKNNIMLFYIRQSLLFSHYFNCCLFPLFIIKRKISSHFFRTFTIDICYQIISSMKIVKHSGDIVDFNPESSNIRLLKSGARHAVVDDILQTD